MYITYNYPAMQTSVQLLYTLRTLNSVPDQLTAHSDTHSPPDELVVVGAEFRLIDGSGRDMPTEEAEEATPPLLWRVGERVGKSAGEDMGVVYLGTALCRLSLLAVRAGWFMRLREPGVASSLALFLREEGYGSKRPEEECLEVEPRKGRSS